MGNKKMKNLAGKQFGEWTVLDEYVTDAKGAYSWKCRCQCGTERMVRVYNLQSGHSQSCGCGRKKTGEKQEVPVPSETGGNSPKGRRRFDIAGQTFRMLTALYATEKRDRNGSVIWHCRCECGNEVDISYEDLKYSGIVSCGCRRKAAGQQLGTHLTHIAGTSVDLLRSKKVRTDNKTGVTGVFQVRGKYRAEIRFQGVTYRLGTFTALETAAAVRKQAEQLLHKDFVIFYDKWKKKAEADPVWKQKNPISVEVKQGEAGNFQVVMLPVLEE